jgi:hypothetical protein
MKKTRFSEFSLDELNLMGKHLPIVERTDGLRHELQAEIDNQTIRSIELKNKYALFSNYELKLIYQAVSIELNYAYDKEAHFQLTKELDAIFKVRQKIKRQQKPTDL